MKETEVAVHEMIKNATVVQTTAFGWLSRN